MRTISLDASDWKTVDDFYTAFFAAVGAPAWHGRNMDAVEESIITGEINQIEFPYDIHILGGANVPEDVRRVLEHLDDIFQKARAETGIAAHLRYL